VKGSHGGASFPSASRSQKKTRGFDVLFNDRRKRGSSINRHVGEKITEGGKGKGGSVCFKSRKINGKSHEYGWVGPLRLRCQGKMKKVCANFELKEAEKHMELCGDWCGKGVTVSWTTKGNQRNLKNPGCLNPQLSHIADSTPVSEKPKDAGMIVPLHKTRTGHAACVKKGEREIRI